jgi:polyribonucleotide nucleotidyltransferase
MADFSSALERAKAIAAKLKVNNASSSSSAPAVPSSTIQALSMTRKREREDDGDGSMQQSLSKYVPKMKMVEVQVPSHMVPLVLGRNGETLRGIETACSVSIDMGPAEDGGKPRKLMIKGDETGVDEAKIRIDDIVHGSGALSVLMGGSHRIGDQTIYVQVPANRVGLVIGKGGETIKSLQDRTGARINVTKDEEFGPNRTIVVSGNQQQLALAQKEIDDIVKGTGFAGAVIYRIHITFLGIDPMNLIFSLVLEVFRNQSKFKKIK